MTTAQSIADSIAILTADPTLLRAASCCRNATHVGRCSSARRRTMVEALSRNSSLVLRSSGRRTPVTAGTAAAAAASAPPLPIELPALAHDSLSLPPAKRLRRDVDAPPRSRAADAVLTVGRLATRPRRVSLLVNGPPRQECPSRPPTKRTTRTRTPTTTDETQRRTNLNGSVRTGHSGPGSPTVTAGATDAITDRTKASGRLTVLSNAPSAGRGDQRKLRSQDGRLHLKSDLSLFFPNYDEIINDEDDDSVTEPGSSPGCRLARASQAPR